MVYNSFGGPIQERSRWAVCGLSPRVAKAAFAAAAVTVLLIIAAITTGVIVSRDNDGGGSSIQDTTLNEQALGTSTSAPADSSITDELTVPAPVPVTSTTSPVSDNAALVAPPPSVVPGPANATGTASGMPPPALAPLPAVEPPMVVTAPPPVPGNASSLAPPPTVVPASAGNNTGADGGVPSPVPAPANATEPPTAGGMAQSPLDAEYTGSCDPNFARPATALPAAPPSSEVVNARTGVARQLMYSPAADKGNTFCQGGGGSLVDVRVTLKLFNDGECEQCTSTASCKVWAPDSDGNYGDDCSALLTGASFVMKTEVPGDESEQGWGADPFPHWHYHCCCGTRCQTNKFYFTSHDFDSVPALQGPDSSNVAQRSGDEAYFDVVIE